MALSVKNILLLLNEKLGRIEQNDSAVTDLERTVADEICAIIENYSNGDVVAEDQLEIDECKDFFICMDFFVNRI